MRTALTLLPLLFFLTLTTPSRADYSPPLQGTTCATNYWDTSVGPVACYPDGLHCSYVVYFVYWDVSGRLVERSFYSGTYDNFWSDICWDRSPWPTSWTGPSAVYHWTSDDTPSHNSTIRAWKREYAGGPCHCYTAYDGFNFGAERTCYAGPIECWS